MKKSITVALIVLAGLFLAAGYIWSQAGTANFTIGDIVELTTNLNVRTGAGTGYSEIIDTDYPGYAPAETIGKILSGPLNADGYVWWEVDFGPGLYSGWSVEDGFKKAKYFSVPCIRFDQERWYFGEIVEGDKVSHTFKVENVGGADLVLQKIKPLCGCTVASVSSETIKPGETAEIEAVFDSRGYHGKVSRFIIVESNDPEMPRKTLVMAGEVRPSSPEINISIDPKVWKFSTSPSEEITERFIIRNEGEQELWIRGSTSHSQYELSTPDRITSQSHATATLKIKPGQESESSSNYIYLEIAIPFTLIEKAL